MKYGPSVFDVLIAPEFSGLTSCAAPEIAGLADYSASFFLNNLFVSTSANAARPAIIMLLRHLDLAVDHYRDGRLQLLECVRAEQHSPRAATLYLRALSQFENAVMRSHLAVACNHAVAFILAPKDTPESPYHDGAGTKQARLRDLANRFKHFDEDILEGRAGNRPAPVWVTDSGLRCRRGDRPIDLSFVELAELLEELRQNAQWLAEESYVEAARRREARNLT